MSIPRKGSRKLVLEGKAFLFLVKQITIPDHADQKAARIVIQRDVEKPGRVLRGAFFFGVAFTPAYVKELIQEGMRLGWDPDERGAAFDLPPDRAQSRFLETDSSSYR